ncbi:MAG: biotin/lipoyl-binding protein [Anaerolineae bacterium]|nr:biotin/lipoyl-binding protein [Anaerolineae bacterium]
MRGSRRFLVYLIVGLAAAFLFVWLLGPRYGIDAPALVRTILDNEGEAPASAASGVVRADTLQVSTALGGRVQAVHVAAGDEVRAGQVVVELDTTLLDAQVAAAQAAVDLARAVLAQVQAGARPGAIQAAEAQLSRRRRRMKSRSRRRPTPRPTSTTRSFSKWKPPSPMRRSPARSTA